MADSRLQNTVEVIMRGYLSEINRAHYEKSYLEFKKRFMSSKSSWSWNINEEQFDKWITQQLPEANKLCMLSIGSGTGDKDYTMIKQFTRKFRTTEAFFVDPSAKFNVIAKSLFERKQSELQGVTCSWFEEKIEDFLGTSKATHSDVEFQFISCIKGLFDVQNAPKVILSLYKRLSVGGLMLFLMPSDVYDWVKFRGHFIKEVYRSDTIWNGKQIAEVFDEAGISYTRTKLEDSMDVACCFDETSEEGSLLLDFYTQAVDFRKQVSPETLKYVLSVLKETAHTTPDGRIICSMNNDVVVAQRIA